jgi:hypothetical protein
MSEEITSGRVEKADLFLPFIPSITEVYDNQPIFRLVVNVSESSSMGQLEQGYYVKFNESVYFVRKKYIHVFTNSQTERVLQFLKKTQAQFTIDVRRDETNSGHQYVQLNDISFNTVIYTVRDYNVYRSLWQLIEGELYEPLYSPSIARFTDNRLVWYTKLMPEHSLAFTQVGKIVLKYVDNQGHLQIYKIEKEGEIGLPNYLYSSRKHLVFFNHQIDETLDVIPLGYERRIIAIGKEIKITSEDHEPTTLQAGQYLLFHPRPRRDGAD